MEAIYREILGNQHYEMLLKMESELLVPEAFGETASEVIGPEAGNAQWASKKNTACILHPVSYHIDGISVQKSGRLERNLRDPAANWV